MRRRTPRTMEEDVSHQDTSFHDQTPLEPHLSPQEPAILPTVVQIPLAEPQILSASPRRRRSSLIKALVSGLLVLMLLLTGTGVYAMERPHIPGGSASISITAASQHVSKTYPTHVTLGSTDPALNPIGARRISITTPTKSLMVPATGTQQEPATYASGVLQLGDGNANSPIPVGAYAIYSNSGVGITFYVSSPIPDNHAPSIHAQAMKPGPGGNIRTFDVNGWYNFPHAFIFAINRHPFSGGHNGYTLTVVSQTDIESATSQLTKQIQSTLAADQVELKSQLASSEQLLDPTTIHCQPFVKANRNPNDQERHCLYAREAAGVWGQSPGKGCPCSMEWEVRPAWAGSGGGVWCARTGKNRLLRPGCPGPLRVAVEPRRIGASRQSDCRPNPGPRSGRAL